MAAERKGIFLKPGEGRDYPMGGIRATQGPGAHSHPEDDAFYVLEGTMSFLLGDEWVDAPKGSFVLAPGGMRHDFENRDDSRAGVLNLSIPGPFEPAMADIAEWFGKHPPGRC